MAAGRDDADVRLGLERRDPALRVRAVLVAGLAPFAQVPADADASVAGGPLSAAMRERIFPVEKSFATRVMTMADAALGGLGTATENPDYRTTTSDSGFGWNGVWMLLVWFIAAFVVGLVIEAVSGGQIGPRPVWIYATIAVVCVAGLAVAAGLFADRRAIVKKRELMKRVDEVRKQSSSYPGH
jgi:hypothetical protein